MRDVRAQAETTYYQIPLDLALNDLIAGNLDNLQRVLNVTQIAYTANLATQGDFINAKFALEATREQLRQQEVTIANDKTALNILPDRRPDMNRLQVDPKFDLTSFETTLDQAIDRAISSRQEIPAGCADRTKSGHRSHSGCVLEYAPDYTVGFGLDHWLIASFGPSPNHTETWNALLSFNVPIFFWAKNEDIKRARQDLDAAGEDLHSIRIQTAGTVTTLYRQILRSRQNRVAVSRHPDSPGPSSFRGDGGRLNTRAARPTSPP